MKSTFQGRGGFVQLQGTEKNTLKALQVLGVMEGPVSGLIPPFRDSN